MLSVDEHLWCLETSEDELAWLVLSGESMFSVNGSQRGSIRSPPRYFRAPEDIVTSSFEGTALIFLSVRI